MAKKQDPFPEPKYDAKNRFPDLGDPDIDERRPAKIAKNYIGPFVEGATKSAARELYRQVSMEMPHATSLLSDIGGTLDELSLLKTSTMTALNPAMTTFRQTSALLLPKLARFLPPKLQAKVKALAKRIDVETAESAAKQKATAEESEIAREVGSLLGTQLRQQALGDEERRLNVQVDRQLSAVRHNALVRPAHATAVSLDRLVSFHTTSHMTYMRRNLAVQYRQLFMLRDIYGLMGTTTRMTELKLEEIKHNSGLPDSAKQTVEDRRIAAGRKSRFEKVSSLGKTIVGNIRKNIVDQLIGTVRQLSSLYGMAGGGISQLSEFGGASMGGENPVAQIGSETGGGLLGYLGATTFGRELIGKVAPFLGIADRGFRGMKTRAAMQLETTRKQWLGELGIKRFIAGTILPNLSSTETIENAAFSDPTAVTSWTRSSDQTLNVIIPGWLGRIHQSLEGIRLGAPQDEIVFNPATQDFTSISGLRESVLTKAFGDATTRGANIDQAIGALRGSLLNKGGSPVGFGFDQVIGTLRTIFSNLAIAWAPFDETMIHRYVGGDTSREVLEYVATATQGIVPHEAKRAFQTIDRIVYGRGNTPDNEVVGEINRYFIPQASDDRYQDVFRTMIQSFGHRRFMHDLVDEAGHIRKTAVADAAITGDLAAKRGRVDDTSTQYKIDLERRTATLNNMRGIIGDQGVDWLSGAQTPFGGKGRLGKLFSSDAGRTIAAMGAGLGHALYRGTAKLLGETRAQWVLDKYHRLESGFTAAIASDPSISTLYSELRTLVKNGAITTRTEQLVKSISSKLVAAGVMPADAMTDTDQGDVPGGTPASTPTDSIGAKAKRVATRVRTKATQVVSGAVNVVARVSRSALARLSEFSALSTDEKRRVISVALDELKQRGITSMAEALAHIRSNFDRLRAAAAANVSTPLATPAGNFKTNASGASPAAGMQPDPVMAAPRTTDTVDQLVHQFTGGGSGDMTIRELIESIADTVAFQRQERREADEMQASLLSIINESIIAHAVGVVPGEPGKSGGAQRPPFRTELFQNLASGVGGIVRQGYRATKWTARQARHAFGAVAGSARRLFDRGVEILPGLTKMLANGGATLASGIYGAVEWGAKFAGSTLTRMRDIALGTSGNQQTFIDVYRKDAYEIGNPLLSRRQQARGEAFFASGEPVKSTMDITEPVFDKDGNVLISEDDIRSGLVTAGGDSIYKLTGGTTGVIPAIMSGKTMKTLGKGVRSMVGGMTNLFGGSMDMFGQMLQMGSRGVANVSSYLFDRITGREAKRDMQVKVLSQIYELLDKRTKLLDPVLRTLYKKTDSEFDEEGYRVGSYADKMDEERDEADAKLTKQGQAVARDPKTLFGRLAKGGMKKLKNSRVGRMVEYAVGGMMSKVVMPALYGAGKITRGAGKAVGGLLGGAARGVGSLAMSAVGLLTSPVVLTTIAGIAATTAAAYGVFKVGKETIGLFKDLANARQSKKDVIADNKANRSPMRDGLAKRVPKEFVAVFDNVPDEFADQTATAGTLKDGYKRLVEFGLADKNSPALRRFLRYEPTDNVGRRDFSKQLSVLMKMEGVGQAAKDKWMALPASKAGNAEGAKLIEDLKMLESQKVMVHNLAEKLSASSSPKAIAGVSEPAQQTNGSAATGKSAKPIIRAESKSSDPTFLRNVGLLRSKYGDAAGYDIKFAELEELTPRAAAFADPNVRKLRETLVKGAQQLSDREEIIAFFADARAKRDRQQIGETKKPNLSAIPRANSAAVAVSTSNTRIPTGFQTGTDIRAKLPQLTKPAVQPPAPVAPMTTDGALLNAMQQLIAATRDNVTATQQIVAGVAPLQDINQGIGTMAKRPPDQQITVVAANNKTDMAEFIPMLDIAAVGV